MDGCAHACVGGVTTHPSQGGVTGLMSLMTMYDMNQISGLLRASSASGGMIGLYTMMTQLMMRAVGVMFWARDTYIPQGRSIFLYPNS